MRVINRNPTNQGRMFESLMKHRNVETFNTWVTLIQEAFSGNNKNKKVRKRTCFH